jgi:formylglycine-generating enzyme required for sulfatase activity
MKIGVVLVVMIVLIGCSPNAAEAPAITAGDLRVVAIVEAADETVWAATASGVLAWFDGRSWHRRESQDPINTLFADSRGRLWIGTDGGLSVVEEGEWHDLSRASVPPGYAALGVTETAGGSIWVGAGNRHTGEGAVARLAGRAWTQWQVHPTLPVWCPSCTSVARLLPAHDLSIWAATTRAGVIRISDDVWTLADVGSGSLHDSSVTALAETRDGAIWVGTNGGLSRFHPESGWTVFHSGVPIRCLLASADGKLWVGTFGGSLLSYRRGVWEEPFRADASIRLITEDPSGRVWVASDRLHLRQPETGLWAPIDGLPGSRITALYAGTDRLWIGFEGGLIVRIDPSDPGRQKTWSLASGAAPPPAVTAAMLDGDLVGVPAGEFLRGSNSDLPEEAPARLISISAFRIDRYEVTNLQYRRFIRATGHPAPPTWLSGEYPVGLDLYPVTGVTRAEAAAYCAWLGKRLPTEAEWEKAARGTDGRRWPWGDGWDPNRLNSSQSEFGQPVAVGSFPNGASPYGLLDMAGNAAEWVQDFFDASYYSTGPVVDPPGPDAVTSMITRGGWWESPQDQTRTSFRGRTHSGRPDFRIGFRCAMSDEQRADLPPFSRHFGAWGASGRHKSGGEPGFSALRRPGSRPAQWVAGRALPHPRT